MAQFFSGNEIYEMAMQMERDGAAFYRHAAARADAADQKDVLLELAGMEDDHLKTFSSMLAKITETDEVQEALSDPENQAARYLQSFAKGKVFDVTKDNGIRDDATMGEVLMFAVDRERASIMFYLGMRDVTPESLGRGEVDRIIREEMGHITILNDKLELLGGA